MMYCLICWGDKEPSETCPRKYCLKCAKNVRRQKERQVKKFKYKCYSNIKEIMRKRAINYYYKNKEKILEYKKLAYRKKVMLSLGIKY